MITAEIKKYKSIFKKKRKNYDKLVLLAMYKLNAIDNLNSKVLIDSYINHDEFSSVKNILKVERRI